MKRLPIAILALALGTTPLVAQFTTPAGYLTTEGLTWQGISSTNGYAYYFGRYADMHYQQVDAEITKKGLQVLTSVAFRPDYRSHSSSTASGRTWSNLTLNLSDGDLATMSSSFAANQLTTPTMVFSGSVTWPDITGNPSSQPAAWSPEYTLPFGTGGGAAVYPFAATKDLCLDYQFSGGVMLNNAAWAGTTSYYYYLDGLYTATAVTYGRNVYKYMGTTTGDCADSAITSGYASGSIQVGLYSKLYSNTSWAGKAVMQIFGSNTAPSSYVLHAIGLNGTTPGVAIPPFSCYNLMFDMSQMILLYNIPTNSSGSRTWVYTPIADLSILAPLGSSVSIWSQAAWTDSQTGKTSLTTAERCTPNFAYPLNSTVPAKKAVYQSNLTSTTGSGPYDYYYLNPITKYN